jgi:hypothetical protein
VPGYHQDHPPSLERIHITAGQSLGAQSFVAPLGSTAQLQKPIALSPRVLLGAVFFSGLQSLIRRALDRLSDD